MIWSEQVTMVSYKLKLANSGKTRCTDVNKLELKLNYLSGNEIELTETNTKLVEWNTVLFQQILFQ